VPERETGNLTGEALWIMQVLMELLFAEEDRILCRIEGRWEGIGLQLLQDMQDAYGPENGEGLAV